MILHPFMTAELVRQRRAGLDGESRNTRLVRQLPPRARAGPEHMAGSPQRHGQLRARSAPWRRTAVAVGLALGLFFLVRAVAEPFVIDMSDPATYRNDWGGPSLFGVLLVHCGPGVLAAIAIAVALIRRRTSGRPHHEPGTPQIRRARA